MAKYRITTPVAGFTGVSVGVNFTKGVAEIDVPFDDPQDPMYRAAAYFVAQGYGVEELDSLEDAGEPAKDDGGDEPKPPARSASKADWVAYATAQGMDADEADKLTRDQLAERFLDSKGADQ